MRPTHTQEPSPDDVAPTLRFQPGVRSSWFSRLASDTSSPPTYLTVVEGRLPDLELATDRTQLMLPHNPIDLLFRKPLQLHRLVGHPHQARPSSGDHTRRARDRPYEDFTVAAGRSTCLQDRF
jgi:hypothetical protein